MSRLFRGGTALDSITFGVGNGPPDEGPITIAVLAHPSATNFTGWILNGHDGTFARWSMLASGNPVKLFMEGDFGSGGPALAADWYWLVGTKASGSVPPRWHVKDLTTGSAWAHVDGSANVSDNTGVATTIVLGNHIAGGAGDSFRGRIAAAATWTGALTDLQVEAACTLSAADLLTAGPGWMVRLNQASTATSVPDDTGHAGGQTAISGTVVDADEPPGWSYALTVAPAPVVTAKQGSWWTLKEIADENRAWNDYERARGPVACPNDGEPLRLDPSGMLHCPFDGWTYEGSGA